MIRDRHDEQPRSRGQSFAEFALILPVFLLVVLIGLDFGRAYMGYVSLQQNVRIAANFASLNPTAWNSPGSATLRQRYKDLIYNDAEGINCDMPSTGQLPDPEFPSGTAIGMPALVEITCRFHIITPFISAILPNPLPITASSSFPIRKGAVAGVTNNGPKPVGTFTCLPTSGTVPLTINCSDYSTHTPTDWSWDFGDGNTSAEQNPSHQYLTTGTFTVTLIATNINGSSTPATHTIMVTPANPGPIAAFTYAPTTGLVAPQIVNFTDTSQYTPTSWSWNFGDGSALVTTQNPSHTFATASTFNVTLTATSQYGSSQITHPITVSAPAPTCLTPDYKAGTNTKWTTAQIASAWTAAQFTGAITYQSTPPAQFKVQTQTPNAGSHPLCSSGLAIVWQ